MAFVVVYDACVLYPASIRDLLVRLARSGLFRARWTERILDECFRSIVAARPELEGKLDRTRRLMSEAIPDALVSGYEGLAGTVELPDEDDRHVLAAAIRSGAQVIVTSNLKDFPPRSACAVRHRGATPGRVRAPPPVARCWGRRPGGRGSSRVAQKPARDARTAPRDVGESGARPERGRAAKARLSRRVHPVHS